MLVVSCQNPLADFTVFSIAQSTEKDDYDTGKLFSNGTGGAARMAIQWLERQERQRLTLTLICHQETVSSATHQMCYQPMAGFQDG